MSGDPQLSRIAKVTRSLLNATAAAVCLRRQNRFQFWISGDASEDLVAETLQSCESTVGGAETGAIAFEHGAAADLRYATRTKILYSGFEVGVILTLHAEAIEITTEQAGALDELAHLCSEAAFEFVTPSQPGERAAFLRHDMRGRIVEVSAKLADMLQAEPGALIGEVVDELLETSSRGQVAEWTMGALGGADRELAVDFRQLNGNPIRLKVRAGVSFEAGRPHTIRIDCSRSSPEFDATAMFTELEELSQKGPPDRFFAQLVQGLAYLSDARAVILSEISEAEPGEAQVLAALLDQHLEQNFTVPITGTTCEQAAGCDLLMIEDGASELFPGDELLSRIEARSYAGLGLRDRRTWSNAVLAVANDEPFSDRMLVQRLLRLMGVFANDYFSAPDAASDYRGSIASTQLVALASNDGELLFLSQPGLRQLGDEKALITARLSPVAEALAWSEVVEAARTTGQWSGALQLTTGTEQTLFLDAIVFELPNQTVPGCFALLATGGIAHETSLSLAVSSMSDGFIVLDKQSRIRTLNSSAAAMIGAERELLTGRKLTDYIRVFHDDQGGTFHFDASIYASVLNNGEPVTEALVGWERHDGELVWLKVNVSPLEQNGEGLPPAVVSSFTDIGRERQAENTVETFSADISELRRLMSTEYETAYHQFSDFLETGRKIFKAEGALLVVFEGEQQVALATSGLVPPRPVPKVKQFDSDVASTPVYSRQKLAAGLCFFALAPEGMAPQKQEMLDMMGRSIGRLLYEQRIETQRLTAEEELKRSEQMFRSLIENSADPIFTIDADGRLRYISPSFEKLSELEAQFLTGMQLEDLVERTERPLMRQVIEKWLRTAGVHESVEFTLEFPNGMRSYLEATASNRLNDPEVNGVVVNSRDIQRRRHAEDRLRLLQSAVDHAGEGIAIARGTSGDPLRDPIVYGNRALAGFCGLDLALILGSTISELGFVAIDSDHTGKPPIEIQLCCPAQRGGARWVRLNAVPISTNASGVIDWAILFYENTQQKRVEDMTRNRSQLLEMVARNEPLSDIYRQIVQTVEAMNEGVICAIVTLRRDLFEFQAGPRVPITLASLFRGAPITQAMGCYWQAVHDQKGQFISDLDTDRFWTTHRAIREELGIAACEVTPIVSSRGQALGFFAAHYTDLRNSTDCSEMLRSSASIAAVAIENRQLSDQLSYQARHDALTGLANRLAVQDELPRVIASARETATMVAVAFIDVDRFKIINDTLGHSAGDRVLQVLAHRLRNTLQPGDMIARMGGDEFAVVIRDVATAEEAVLRAEGMLDMVRGPIPIKDNEMFVTGSIGVSLYPEHGAGSEDLLRHADNAMHRAKSLGKNNIQLYLPEMSGVDREQMELESALRRALENQELRINYQPLVDVTGALAGAEALLCWEHPRLGRLPATTFIPIAEETGLIVPIGAWVLEQACRQNAAWRRSGLHPIKIAVNVSAVQFSRPDFIDTVAQALALSRLDPRHLELELTESLVMKNVNETIEKMSMLRAVGVGISIDDFGTGYSSLSYLRKLPVDTLKIDRSFIKGIEMVNEPSLPLVQTIISLAHTMGLTVVAEGVERMEQLEILRRAGCDRIQGHLFSMPVHPNRLEALLRSQQTLIPDTKR